MGQQRYWESHHQGIPPETREVLNQYLLHLKISNKAEATIKKYKWILEQIFTDCTIPLKQLTSEDVYDWFQTISLGKKPKTKDLYYSTLSSFFHFCLVEDSVDVDILLVKKRWKPKVPKAIPKFLTESEYAKVKREAETLSLRDRALVLFLFSSGCRKSEVISLKIQGVNLDRRTAKVMGKGKKIRTVHFSEECGLVLKEYLKTRSGDETEPLFLNKFKGPLNKNGIQLVINKLGRKAGLSESLYPHKCRHTFATNMLSRGAKLLFLAKEMGHNDINTTRIYARIPTEDMRMEYDNKME